MKIISDREELLKHINSCIRAIGSKGTQEILKCFLLKATTEGASITSTDLKLYIESAKIDCLINETGSILVDAKMFSEIIRKLPSGNVTIESGEDNFIHITSGHTKFKLLGREADEFPTVPEVEKSKCIKVNAKIFSEMIETTIFSTATEDIKPILTGELIEIENSVINVVAIDGFRIAHAYSGYSNPSEKISIVVPSRSLLEISKIISENNEEISLYATSKHLLIESLNCTIVTRLLDGEYMDYKKIFNESYTSKIKVDRLTLLNSLERAVLVARETVKTPVKFTITDNNLQITSNTEKGNSFDELVVDTTGEEITIAFNPKYIMDVLKTLQTTEVYMQFTTQLSPCIIKGVNDETKKYLVLPLRLKH